MFCSGRPRAMCANPDGSLTVLFSDPLELYHFDPAHSQSAIYDLSQHLPYYAYSSPTPPSLIGRTDYSSYSIHNDLALPTQSATLLHVPGMFVLLVDKPTGMMNYERFKSNPFRTHSLFSLRKDSEKSSSSHESESCLT